jgi:alcohol dehydrogenase, propanol-preferring
VDFVGNEKTFAAAQELAGAGGRIVMVGLANDKLTWNYRRVFMKELTIQSSFWGSTSELREVLAHIGAGAFTPVVAEVPMHELPVQGRR